MSALTDYMEIRGGSCAGNPSKNGEPACEGAEAAINSALRNVKKSVRGFAAGAWDLFKEAMKPRPPCFRAEDVRKSPYDHISVRGLL